jgi:hypothetical protein
MQKWLEVAFYSISIETTKMPRVKWSVKYSLLNTVCKMVLMHT